MEQVPLSSFHVFSSVSVEEAVDRISTSFCPHRLRIEKTGDALNARYHRVPLVSTTLNYLQYGAEVVVDPEQFDSFFMVEVPLKGSARVRIDGRDFTSSPSRGLVLSPTVPLVSTWSHDCRQIMLKIDRRALELYLAEVIDQPIVRPLEFTPEFDVKTGFGRFFFGNILYLVDQRDSVTDAASNRMLLREIARLSAAS